ncbi:MAG: DUF4230 domain-containing protein [Ignavibacteria bacterium]|nr:DUF4230 domain-containing protein [Ignavibacteria bacterium]
MEDEERNEIIVLRKYKRKVIKLTIIAGLIIVVLLTIFLKGYSDASEKYENTVKELQDKIDELSDPTAKYTVATKEVTIDLIKSEIDNIGELATIEYLYTNAGKFENTKQFKNFNIPFTTKSFIAKWDGIIKVGVKIDQIIVQINDANKEIIVNMPKSVILSHEIKKESIETLDEKDGLFNSVKVDDVREFDKVSKEAMEERAIENGILDKATENAKEIIEKLVNNDVVQEQGYIIKFKIIE